MNNTPGIIRRSLAKRGMGQIITVAAGLVVLCLVFWRYNEMFWSSRNIHNLSRQIVPILLVGISQSYVLITGNIDLSIGSVLGMSSMISATLMTRGANPWLAVVVAMACSLVIGVLNGVLVAKCRLPPFIATLGTMTIARGIAQIVNNNRNTDSIGEAAEFFQDVFYYGETLGLYNPVWMAVVLWFVFNFVLSRTRTGRHVYAVGSNIEASRLSGVNVAWTVVFAYLVSAFCSGFVGLFTTATSGMGAMDAGNMYELYAVAASVIGGVSTLGGQGLLLGTVIGSCIWCVLQNGLLFAQAPVAIRNILVGAIVVLSVLMDVLIRNGRWKFRARKPA